MNSYENGANLNPQELMSAFNDVKRDVNRLVSQVKGNYAGLNAELHRHATERPLVLLGAAFGAGFVLGGGVFSRLFFSLAATAIRSSLTGALPSMLMNMQAAMGNQEETESDQSVMAH